MKQDYEFSMRVYTRLLYTCIYPLVIS